MCRNQPSAKKACYHPICSFVGYPDVLDTDKWCIWVTMHYFRIGNLNIGNDWSNWERRVIWFLLKHVFLKKTTPNYVAFATGNGKVFTENYYIITCNLIACFEKISKYLTWLYYYISICVYIPPFLSTSWSLRLWVVFFKCKLD